MYHPVIGLEIHAELRTNTKMFCSCKNDSDETRPNANICPVCMAHPGTLPVINGKAVEHVLRVGTAVGGTLATNFTEFDRKNYFYPDIPKGYQISQYKYPLVSGGSLAGVELTRIHLEEDTATSKHDKGDYSLVDYNRAGVPLMELVTEPVISDAETAMRFAKELQLLLRYLGASNANAFEIERQIATLETGGVVVQETRGWDENKGETFSQRKKESSHDYRYFPDPDLPKLNISEINDRFDMTLPELPQEKRERYAREYGIKAEDIESYVVDGALGAYFERVADILNGDAGMVALASNYITSAEEGGDPRAIATERDLFQKSDADALGAIVDDVLAANPQIVAEYRAGKVASLQFLIGQGMKVSKGSANPTVLKTLFEEKLK